MEYQNLRGGEFNDNILLHARGLDFWCMLEGGDTTEKALHFAASQLRILKHNVIVKFCLTSNPFIR